MADKDKMDGGMDQMFQVWEQGQNAFFKAQTEAIETFNKSFENMPDFSSQIANQSGEFANQFTKSGNAFLALLEPANWTQYAPEQLRVILQSIAEGPKFADLATPQHEAAETWRETLDYTQAAADMGKVMQDAWVRTYGRFNKDHSIEDLKAPNPEEAMNAWLAAANHELLDTQRSPKLNASLQV